MNEVPLQAAASAFPRFNTLAGFLVATVGGPLASKEGTAWKVLRKLGPPQGRCASLFARHPCQLL